MNINSYEPNLHILHDVAQGLENAMDHCINQYGGLVWTIAKRYVKNPSSAEDLVQEIFTDLWKSACRYDSKVASESTFIGMLARRRAIDFARKENRQPDFEPLSQTGTYNGEYLITNPNIACKSECIRSAITELSDETKTIFTQYFDQGMTHSEIAKETGFPLGTVKSRLRRGLIEVRNKLRISNINQPLRSETS